MSRNDAENLGRALRLGEQCDLALKKSEEIRERGYAHLRRSKKYVWCARISNYVLIATVVCTVWAAVVMTPMKTLFLALDGLALYVIAPGDRFRNKAVVETNRATACLDCAAVKRREAEEILAEVRRLEKESR